MDHVSASVSIVENIHFYFQHSLSVVDNNYMTVSQKTNNIIHDVDVIQVVLLEKLGQINTINMTMAIWSERRGSLYEYLFLSTPQVHFKYLYLGVVD